MRKKNTATAHQLSEAAKAARAAYKRRWNAEHPEAVRRYNAEYWERRAAEFHAARRAEEQEARQ